MQKTSEKLSANTIKGLEKARQGLKEVLFESFPDKSGKEISDIANKFIGNFLYTLEIMQILYNGRKENKTDEEILDSCDDETNRDFLALCLTIANRMKGGE